MNYTNLHYPLNECTLPVNAYDATLVHERKEDVTNGGVRRGGCLFWFVHRPYRPVDPQKFQCVLMSVSDLVFVVKEGERKARDKARRIKEMFIRVFGASPAPALHALLPPRIVQRTARELKLQGQRRQRQEQGRSGAGVGGGSAGDGGGDGSGSGGGGGASTAHIIFVPYRVV